MDMDQVRTAYEANNSGRHAKKKNLLKPYDD